MAGAVRIEDEAFADPRFAHLGSLLGTSTYDALGRMAFIWRICTQRCEYILDRKVVAMIIDPDKVVASDLAVKVRGGVRIKGTEGRVEWLRQCREAAKEGGLKRAATASRTAGRFASDTSRTPAGVQPESSRTAGNHQPTTSRPPADHQPESSPLTLTPTTPLTPKTEEKDTECARRPAFQPPTLEEVRAYCLERGNRVNPEQFVDYYTANGWVQGRAGKPVKDWKACVRTWERNDVGGRRGAAHAPTNRDAELLNGYFRAQERAT